MGDNCFALLKDYRTFNYRAKFIFLLTFFFTLTIFSIQVAQADIISINSGGSEEIVIIPDPFIEGFFTGGICGDGVIDSGLGERCDDGNIASGDGCSSTCQTEVVTPPPGDGDGGGGGGVITPTININVDPTEFNIDLAINTVREERVLVTNLGTSETTVQISQEGLDNNIILGTNSLTIQPGQNEILDIVFVALGEPGILVGKIKIGNKEVLVTLNIKTKLLLFDSNIVVLNKDLKVEQGDELETLVSLIPFGDPTRLDVTLEFTIRDFGNNIFLTKSETLLIEERIRLNRNFDTGNLPIGDYVVGLILRYPNGVAPSSASFEVVEKVPLSIFGRIVLFLVILILLVLIAIIIVLIIRKLRDREKANP